jgi:agmatinase
MRWFAIGVAAVCLVGVAPVTPSRAADETFDPKTAKPIIDMMRESPDTIPLEPRDPGRDVRVLYRDCHDNPKRDPGPINIQRTLGGLAWQGIPTFFHAPVALCPEDLRAGKVDVAIMGASIDLTLGQRGTAYGPQAVRMGEVLGPWGSVLSAAHPVVGDIDFMQVLNVVDYGDAAIDPYSAERTVLSVHGMVKDILQAGAMPVIVGGDHSLMYPDVVAAAEFYGKGQVGVVHFDAHFDGVPLLFGHYLTNGAPVRRLIDEGWVNGRNFIQIGLNSIKPSGSDMAWMRKNQMRFHFTDEIDRNGWPALLARALAEARDGPKKIFVSIDIDVLDPTFAPGVGTPEPGGMTIRELFPILRGLGAQNDIVGIELVELNPLADQTYRTRLVAVRILRELLTGVAMNRKGITDPTYVAPDWKDNGVPLSTQ